MELQKSVVRENIDAFSTKLTGRSAFGLKKRVFLGPIDDFIMRVQKKSSNKGAVRVDINGKQQLVFYNVLENYDVIEVDYVSCDDDFFFSDLEDVFDSIFMSVNEILSKIQTSEFSRRFQNLTQKLNMINIEG
jgi:hypothetical protein